MRTLDEALNQFAYHPATPEVSAKYAELRARVMGLAGMTWDLIPDGPEKTLAFRGLQQFLMHANLAIAMTTPADLKTPDVARVLPEEVRGQTSIDDKETCNCGQVGIPAGKTQVIEDGITHYPSGVSSCGQ